MTTLYRPVEITSVEQAEALPKGSILFDGDPEYGDTYVQGGDDWHTDGYPHVLSEALRCGLEVRALVPIEVEVEHLRTHAGTSKTLYVTDWTQEEA